MNIEQKIRAFSDLGRLMKQVDTPLIKNMIEKAYLHNNWFTKDNIRYMLFAWSETLTEKSLEKWLSAYKIPEKASQQTIGVIMAGNIPMVGFHDLLSVVFSGKRFAGKLSSKDNILLPFFIDQLKEIEPGFKELITFTEMIRDVDAIIATGSNNSARYFEHYFGKYPNIIRKNRTSVAVLTGQEKPEQLARLGQDIFRYFGLGCRNVSKLYVPKDHSFDLLFESMYKYGDVIQHTKYMNNFDYNLTLLMMNQTPHLTNNFLIIRESKELSSPVSVLHYEYYDNAADLKEKLDQDKNALQCIVGENCGIEVAIPFGTAQQPTLWDYADGVDTIQFLLGLKGT